MNHDLAHCDAQYYMCNKKYNEYTERFCRLRKKCKRYKTYLDLNGKEKKFPITFISAYECVTKKHKLYWEDKE